MSQLEILIILLLVPPVLAAFWTMAIIMICDVWREKAETKAKPPPTQPPTQPPSNQAFQ